MYNFAQVRENMPNKVATNLRLYDRMMALKKARRETVEEFAKVLGTTAASIRAYKLNPEREARPRTIRKLEELEALLGKPSSVAASREPFESPSRMETASKNVHSIEAGPQTMIRLAKLQALAEDNRADIIQIKRQIEHLVELLGQPSREPEKRKRA